MLTAWNIQAQTTPEEEEEEKEREKIEGYNTGAIKLGDPKSVVEAYTYDPTIDRYILTKTFEGFNINYPLILTPKEYEQLVMRESMRDYFQKKSRAVEGKGDEKDKKDLLPRYYVNSSFFESIFGSNTIDIKPTGSVEVDLGVRHTKQDNPSFSPRNRSTTTFDFNQRISMSLMGKVGTRLNVNANYDTQSTFNFQNLIKLEYAPTEDDIIQKIEVGNVSMPLNSTLIRGAQSLFGVKAQLQFGKTTVTGVFSEQKSQTKTVTSQGGGTIQDFQLFAQEYDNDRHFFLSQYFKNKYDFALRNYPFIDSRVQITRIEVWVTNKQNRVNNTNNNQRNIIALQDLGETRLTDTYDNSVLADNRVVAVHPDEITNGFFLNPTDAPTDNSNNRYDPALIGTTGLLNSGIRQIFTAGAGFNNINPVSEGTDYAKLENARKLAPSEYTYHPQLGYVSLQQRLANDEVLAVAYQYTIGGEVYQVGEFGTDGVDATQVNTNTGGQQVPTSQSLILKMLKSSLTFVDKPIWGLMMKNIYQIPGGYQLQKEDFKFNILYTDPSPLNYIVQANPTSPLPNGVQDTPLLRVFSLDQLNFANDPQTGGDGFFDFVQGLTIDQQNGRIIFTKAEPFGRYLFEKLRGTTAENYYGDPTLTTDFNANQSKYVFRKLYTSTQAAALQESEKNKFQLRGKFKSSGGEGIPIGAFNVPQGSVVVMAGGRRLVEGVDYTVNYQAGRVQILDPSLQASNTPIEVSVENNSVFGQQTRRFMGVNVEHKFNSKAMVGATFLKMSERPFTQKSNYGQESVNNTMFGINTNLSSEVPFLTRLVNKLPNVDTDVPSNVSFRGEIAYLMPNTPKGDRFNGESTLYVDDFEGSQTNIDLRSPLSWFISSTPERPATGNVDYSDFNGTSFNLDYGFKRAKIAWYTIDPIFYTQRPTGITQDDLSLNSTRRIYSSELYPQTVIAQGQSQVVSTLDLSFYPQERGPYNFSTATQPDGTLPNPDTNFGGIMRSLNSTNFEQSNVEYIQFWMMDPYYDPNNPGAAADLTNTGQIYFNLGEISEDILKDGRKFYENGLGPNQVVTNETWGNVPASQSLIYAFDTDTTNRNAQDVGYDGLNDAEEAAKYSSFASFPDPAADNYNYYLNANGDVLERYKSYNNVQGNSPVDVTDTNRGSTTIPDVEDINRDNTMNTINAYYEYRVNVSQTSLSNVGANYITDIRETEVTAANGLPVKARWIQFKIPVAYPTNTIGSISDFRSIRFMRIFMTKFNQPITLRFGSLDLVRGEWRRYENTLDAVDTDVTDDGTDFDVQALNVQENGSRSPINYVTPPGVQLEQLYQNNTLIPQNEQSLSLRASGLGLEPGDSRGVFKNVSVDMRQFKKIKMFLHAEALPDTPSSIEDDELVGFIRFGNDVTDNFYQIELPLKKSQFNDNTPSAVWPDANQIDVSLSLLTQLKVLALSHIYTSPGEIYFKYEDELDNSLSGKANKARLGIRGNPNFGLIRVLMVGIKNNTHILNTAQHPLNPRRVAGEAWFNELRIADMDNKGGMAAVANLDANLADFANLSATGKMSTIGFGSIDQGPNERSREDILQYNVVTNMSLGKLLPKKWNMNVPFNYAVGEEIITPKYDPYYQDIELQQLIDYTADEAQKRNIRNRAMDYTKRKSINFIGVKKDRGEKQKPHFYDVENVTLSYSYNQMDRHSYELESYQDQQVNTAVDYTYAFQNKPVEPFKKVKRFQKSSYWKLLSDFNFNFLPSNISFSSNINRQLNRQNYRLVDVEGIGLQTLYQRNYLFNYQYGFNYNLTKSLKVNFNATSSNIVRNYLDENNVPDNTYTLWTDFWNPGLPNTHNQQLTVNYELPLSKIPFLAFIKPTYTYNGTYSWQRASVALSSYTDANGVVYNLGNTIQNSGSHKLNTQFNMETLYKYLGLTKTKKNSKSTQTAPPKPGQKITNTTVAPQAERSVFMEGLIGVLTSVKNVQINYSENQGTALPGFIPGLGFFGSSKPSLGFVFGLQDDVRFEAAKRGWLTTYQNFNQNYTEVLNRTLDVTANIDLFPDFKIDLSGNRTYATNFSEQYDVTNGNYNSRSPYTTGNFAISTNMILTSFQPSDEFGSAAFDKFRENRMVIAHRLAQQYYQGPYNLDAEGYPEHFGKNSQDVLLPAFIAAYTGKDANSVSTGIFKNIPIPGWNIKYSGLMRYKFFKDNFKRFSIQHNYKASYTINAFRSNIDYVEGAVNPLNNNFYAKTIVGNVNLVEQFSPLFRIDFETKSSFKLLLEMKKDRALSFSFDNNLLTEQQGLEYIVGTGFRFKDVIISSRLADNPTGVIKSDINIKLDLSYRNSKTIVRYLDYNNNQLGGGQNLWSAKMTADYSFSKNLTAIFFYDHTFSKAVISTSFPITNIRTGFTLRYNFGN
ncbi:T9SS outer membrane translocon Sov/SprA [Flavobacterium stagni]|uniref:Cell surface protein SprA n=1 Tax=Flavobacterium stagni TaxID=2506421 RepID=A0A4Q1KCN7_9FLAO|nr:cell surface protein SprA [Flavobacterium stagni]RXR24697.1 cell surface protein SprA [Flavobacterium stagni]